MAWCELYLSCQGRLSRRQYWLASLPLIGAQILIELLIASEIEPVLAALLSLGLAVPSFVITIKRLHDRGRNGWFASIAAIPFLGAIWLLIEAGLLPGVRGPNRFGPDPLEAAGAGGATSAAAPI
jgi:uncharacterized membrane protein YhaH (DUF805 family)